MPNRSFAFDLFMIAALVAALSGTPQAAHAATGPICHVDADAAPGGDGNGWGTAYNDLQAALADSACTQIWVANGTYKPTTGSDRSISFALKNGVGIYGGFHGDPAGETDISQRDWTLYIAILSGDIGTGGDPADNSTHVVTAGTGIIASAILDGFTITGGNADGGTFLTSAGGGMLNTEASPTLTNLILTGNRAADGGGMTNSGAYPHLTDVEFSDNTATSAGGGMFNNYADPVLEDVTFSSNDCTQAGGGLANYYSNPSLTDVTISGNTAVMGGGMDNRSSNATLTHVTFSGNIAGEGGGMYNHQSDPNLLFVTFDGNASPADAFGRGKGGGMYNYNSDPGLAEVIFSANKTPGSTAYAGRGAGMYNTGSSPTLWEVYFIDNIAEPHASGPQDSTGGGMHNDSLSSPTLTYVAFHANFAHSGGGMLSYGGTQTLTDVGFSDNVATSQGGGMYNGWNTAVLSRVTFDGNTASHGGGMFNYDDSTVTMTDVIFDGNHAVGGVISGSGGGMFNWCASPTLTNGIFKDNQAVESGGGMMTYYDSGMSGCTPPTPTLTNVTFSGNLAVNGGAIGTHGSNPVLKNVTVAGNTATNGPGLYAWGGAPQIYNSIFWNTSSDPDIVPFSVPISFTIVDSVVQSGCPAPAPTVCTNVITTEPWLVPLADNGGFSQTMALGLYSSAIDAGDANVSQCPGADQRGESRPQDGDQDGTADCDIGAYEKALYIISGNTGAPGVTLGYYNWGDKTVVSGGTGDYSIEIPEHWVGTVTPSKTDYLFTPDHRDYADVTADQPDQDYSAGSTTPTIASVFPEPLSTSCRKPQVGVNLILTALVRLPSGAFNPATVTLKLDNIDRSSQATITQSVSNPASHATILYAPPSNLSTGSHMGTFIYPSAGGPVTYNWNFTVANTTCPTSAPAEAPVITAAGDQTLPETFAGALESAAATKARAASLQPRQPRQPRNR